MLPALTLLSALVAAPTLVAAPAPVGAPAPVNGWAAPAAPNRRILPLDLSRLDESKLLRSGKQAALYAIGASATDYKRERLPVILVHGIRGAPKDLQAVATRLARPDRQIHVLAYDGWGRRTSQSGSDFADELRTLQRFLGGKREIVILAHSMGGLVSRWALNELYIGPAKGLERFARVRLYTADSPWHGYGGPSDRGVEGWAMNFVRVFMPDALEDMRAKSNMFQGDPGSRDPAAKAGLLKPILPENAEVDVVFAQQGSDIWDYTEPQLQPLVGKLVAYYRTEAPVRGEAWLENFWKALIQARNFYAFDDEVEGLSLKGKLDDAAMRAALLRHYPRFPGDHMGVLQEHKGQRSLLDYWSDLLASK
jgi:pimeloyl-ACP methyl ester carboxylesterase